MFEMKSCREYPEKTTKMKTILETKEDIFKYDKEIGLAAHTRYVADLGFATIENKVKNQGKKFLKIINV